MDYVDVVLGQQDGRCVRAIDASADSALRARATALAPSAAAGFTLIELMITLAIFGILIVMGMPSMSAWVASAKVNSLTDFYLDGLQLARNGALQKSAASRFVLTVNSTTNQYNWQVDWCFPTSALPCDTGGSWSTTTVAAAGDTNAANPSLSVRKSARSQPPITTVAPSLTPSGVLSVYFNAQGWVNTFVQPFLRQMRFDPNAVYNPNPSHPNVRSTAISINLSGIAERCDPVIALTNAADSRACSP